MRQSDTGKPQTVRELVSRIVEPPTLETELLKEGDLVLALFQRGGIAHTGRSAELAHAGFKICKVKILAVKVKLPQLRTPFYLIEDEENHLIGRAQGLAAKDIKSSGHPRIWCSDWVGMKPLVGGLSRREAYDEMLFADTLAITVGGTYKAYELGDEGSYEEVMVCGTRVESSDNHSARYLTYRYCSDGVWLGEARPSTAVPECDLVFDFLGNYPYGNEPLVDIIKQMKYSEEDAERVMTQIAKDKRIRFR